MVPHTSLSFRTFAIYCGQPCRQTDGKFAHIITVWNKKPADLKIGRIGFFQLRANEHRMASQITCLLRFAIEIKAQIKSFFYSKKRKTKLFEIKVDGEKVGLWDLINGKVQK